MQKLQRMAIYSLGVLLIVSSWEDTSTFAQDDPPFPLLKSGAEIARYDVQSFSSVPLAPVELVSYRTVTTPSPVREVVVEPLTPLAVTERFTHEEQAERFLKEHRFREALHQYDLAIMKNPRGDEHRYERDRLAEVITMREQLLREMQPTPWMLLARQLREYYKSKRIDALLLETDRAIYERHPTIWNAAHWAESCLFVGHHAEALAIIEHFPPKTHTVFMKVLRCEALLALGRRDLAQRVAADVAATEEGDAGIFYRLAVVRVRTGLRRMAVEAIVVSFQRTPAAKLAEAKVWAQNDPELAPITESQEFAEALLVRSQVQEAYCDDSLKRPMSALEGARPRLLGITGRTL